MKHYSVVKVDDSRNNYPNESFESRYLSKEVAEVIASLMNDFREDGYYKVVEDTYYAQYKLKTNF